MSKLPQESVSQEIGRIAGRALSAQMPLNWLDKPLDGDTDFGIDYLVQLKSPGGDVSYSFYLQLKGTTSPKYAKTSNTISHSFEVKNINYYMNQEPLVMVAIVDLSEYFNSPSDCPIYYKWLDENWYVENSTKIEENDTVSVVVETENRIDSKLQIFDYYRNRINEKLVVAKLRQEIVSNEEEFEGSVSNITRAFSRMPVFLEVVKNDDEVPWIVDPQNQVSTKLKVCNDNSTAYITGDTLEILQEISTDCEDLSVQERAEFHYQYGVYYELLDDSRACSEFRNAFDRLGTERYQVAMLECKLKWGEVPTERELRNISQDAEAETTRSAMLKAKSMAVGGDPHGAIDFLVECDQDTHLNKIIIYSISSSYTDLDELLKTPVDNKLKTDREKYLFYSLSALRYLMKSNNNSLPRECDSVIFFDEQEPLEHIKRSVAHCNVAWRYAKKLGYPNDIWILLDVSQFLLMYSKQHDELVLYVEEIFKQRKGNVEITELYKGLLFHLGKYDKLISVINESTVDSEDDFEILFMAYTQTNTNAALELLGEKRGLLQNQPIESAGKIFCIGAYLSEMALDYQNAEKYKSELKKLDGGEPYLALCEFYCNSHVGQDNREELYSEYLRLGKPFVIAEQLMSILNPTDMEHAKHVIEIAEYEQANRALNEGTYCRLGQAYLVCGRHNDALKLANMFVHHDSFDPYWIIVKYLALTGMGKPGIALALLEESLDTIGNSKDYLSRYVEACSDFDLRDKAEEPLRKLFSLSNTRNEKVHYLAQLVSIYIADSAYVDKLLPTIKMYGELVDKNDAKEEASYLANFALLGYAEPEMVADFRKRLAAYSEMHPQSSTLRLISVDASKKGSDFIRTLQDAAGISEEQMALWQRNRNLIKQGTLKYPFHFCIGSLANREMYL